MTRYTFAPVTTQPASELRRSGAAEVTCAAGLTAFRAKRGALLDLVVDGRSYTLDGCSTLVVATTGPRRVGVREILPGHWWHRAAIIRPGLGLSERLWWRDGEPLARWPRVAKLIIPANVDPETQLRAHLESVPLARRARRVDLLLRLLAAGGELFGRSLEGFSLARIARRASLSPSHYLRLHDAVFGATPYVAFQAWRMRLAARLLEHSDLATTEVAVIVGFDNRCSFSRSFSRFHGLPPGRFRERRRAVRTVSDRVGPTNRARHAPDPV